MSNKNNKNNNENLNELIVNKNSRLTVIQTLLKVQNGLSLSALLDPLLTKTNPQDKGFIHALLLTSLRHWHATARLMDSLAKQPIEEIEVRTTIQVGITQLLYLEVADHACIFETVEAVKKLGFAHASGLVNAILRKVSSNPIKYRKKCDKKHSLPNWLAKQLKQDWSENYDELTAALRHSAPLYLRTNDRQTNNAEYAQLLEADEIVHSIESLESTLKVTNNKEGQSANIQITTTAIRLEQSTNVTKLPDFVTGKVSVQDAHAMLAGNLVKTLIDSMTADKPLHILDACTAPSGKLAHCIELFDTKRVVKVKPVKVGVDNDGNDKLLRQHVLTDTEKAANDTSLLQFTAIDSDNTRLERSQQTLERIGVADEAKLICADATRWQLSRTEPEQFDIILLDAPCTATGVIRRHPDISLLRQEGDVAQTVELQAKILDNLWQQLKPNGYIIYATCSLLKAENTEQMQRFVSRQSADNVNPVNIDGNWGIQQEIGRQCLPLDLKGGDGFYYAVLQKTSTK